MTSEISNDFIVNPYTGRLIKKGSKTYERLLNARLLNEEKPSTSEENVVIKAESNDQAKTIQSKLNKNLQKNKVVTRRGSTVLKASRRPTRKEVIDRVSDIATNVVRENRDDILESEMNGDQLDDYIKNLIQLKLISDNKSLSSKKPIDTQPKRIATRPSSLEERIRQRQLECPDDDIEDD